MQLFFDLDGTLLDVRLRYTRAHQAALRSLGRSSLGGAEYWRRKWLGWSEPKIVAGLGLNTFERQCYQRRRIELLEDPEFLALDRLQPEVAETRRRLGQDGHELVLVTMRHQRGRLCDQLHGLGLHPVFTTILTPWRPGCSPALAKAAAIARYRQGREGPALVIGDSEADGKAARKLGLPFFALSSGMRDERLLQELHPVQLSLRIDSLVFYISGD